jgi:hypothetical protein
MATPTPQPTKIAAVLGSGYAPFASTGHNEKGEHFPPAELVLTIDDATKPSDQITALDVKKKIAQAHGIPVLSIALFRDAEHKHEITNPGEIIADGGQRVYWLFIGDAPSNWASKKNEIVPVFDRLLAMITEQLDSSTFFLEKDFFWDDGTTNLKKQTDWIEKNNLPDASVRPKLPLHVTLTHDNRETKTEYRTSKKELEFSYNDQNISWRKTKEYIIEKIIKIRTDKEQYERNLKQLLDNDKLLREQFHQISGQLYPPFPDQALYSSLFHHNPPYQVTESLTYQSLISAIDSNTRYYNQQLGKYNVLKKEECHLIEKYQQLMTRMKLWILRERIRLIAWELMYTDIYADADIEIKLREVLEFQPMSFDQIAARKRSYQCVDFCQCEFGCSLLFKNEKHFDVKRV